MAGPLDVGSVAPDFILKDQNNEEVQLSTFRGHRTVLLVFYPLAFSGHCQGELGALRDRLDDFTELAEVLTVSVDSAYAHKVWATEQGYEFPLLADFWPHGAVAQAYGVFNSAKGYADRGTFVVDIDGIIRYAAVNEPGTPRDPEEWLKALAAL
ncbi:MAG: peroxiredoxin [Hamadaea sp.]|uniref:peroxiredoxin n=1 Tax=Hamadaea sp. TaxID=2024425 RepID=UPI0017E00F1B|nr:peroxiredoxin [Hamadaea sp.]NUR74469.1 peroxiredoxin [Hamadaea sp.]NUT03606.1 peroxiredoxin [Hamadaea sp.]NUT24066.1 peroxiredoxin [Hamadaea sp.]